MQKTRTPYDIIKARYVTEKAKVLEELQSNESNRCVRKCTSPKYVFIVDKNANKQEIAKALEEIFTKNKIKVTSVNTVNVPPKRRRLRGREGFKPGFKKAIVTLEAGDTIES